jgi:hypothetical protein
VFARHPAGAGFFKYPFPERELRYRRKLVPKVISAFAAIPALEMNLTKKTRGCLACFVDTHPRAGIAVLAGIAAKDDFRQ